MHILFLTDNFPPEGNAPATRTFEHAKVWVEQGHKVTIITCAPNFPEGKLYAGYKNKFYQKELMDGIEVRRVKTYITANEGFLKRSLDYLSFMFSAFIAGLFVKKPDIVVATSPQFFCACAGWALSFLRRKPFVFELRDIWPASIVAVGASKESRLIRILEGIELFLYRRAKIIVSVTKSFKSELIDRGIEADKIRVVLNGVDTDAYRPREKDAVLAQKYGLTDKFVAGYVGTHGMAHALESLVEVADRLSEDADVMFLFAGGGAAAEQTRNLIESKNLKNVVFLGRQAKETMPAIWSLCDVSIVHLKNTELFSKVIPSKIFESFAMGLPVIIGLPEGEATAIIRDHDAGMIVEPENVEQMGRAIQSLSQDIELHKRYGANSLKAAPCFDRRELALKMLKELETAAH